MGTNICDPEDLLTLLVGRRTSFILVDTRDYCLNTSDPRRIGLLGIPQALASVACCLTGYGDINGLKQLERMGSTVAPASSPCFNTKTETRVFCRMNIKELWKPKKNLLLRVG
ncbi:uncharacterized protein N7500_007399 [Penicillium coprophilum]|uniref:uncharacterized protein n=1 Tax=Penicillium coprophilum TaxID=36646 RepID=UPI00238AAE00|nr:uncharacterized protein N7500_007399 [Penicillium coprophilum]KAJ5165569.1 hypothetical protein N7500_007399 [Penicillium coprophilum]